ncbi:hypothetical protein [Hyphomicrobium sp.]|uniref:hypothetical protein n=1 Tax=Hyphomicrobium sp. TaxID=82 RepID=UPI003F723F59
MHFRWSAEVFKDASDGLRRCSKAVDAYLQSGFAKSDKLSDLPITVRYVPIAMPHEALHRYPARSKLRKKERLYDCAPQLDYDVFVSGTFEEQLREYLRGLAETTPHLKELGANDDQVVEFESILRKAVDEILTNEIGQTRH